MSTGLHVRRATGLTVAEREKTQTESVARWSREGLAVYEAEREAFGLFMLVFSLSFRPGVRCSTRQKISTREGTGIFLLPEIFGFISVVSLRCALL